MFRSALKAKALLTPQKRLFNQKFDGHLNKFINKLPQKNPASLVVGLNTLLYGAYLVWPANN